jgi:hypothetical protein
VKWFLAVGIVFAFFAMRRLRRLPSQADADLLIRMFRGGSNSKAR